MFPINFNEPQPQQKKPTRTDISTQIMNISIASLVAPEDYFKKRPIQSSEPAPQRDTCHN